MTLPSNNNIIDSCHPSPNLQSHSPSEATDQRMDLIKDRALATIREQFPLSSLFKTKLKIDLGACIKDQILFCRIADLLRPLLDLQQVDIVAVKEVFAKSAILSEIKELFKDPEPFLPLLYAGCVDALLKKTPPNGLNAAIEGRIFTIKNALIAQHTPEAISKNQAAYQVTKQSHTDIKKEGSDFICSVLTFYLHRQEAEKAKTFREVLTSNAEQLIPFVKKITRLYLHEFKKYCPDNPLTFRNPTGYNFHGNSAATIMEVCLSAIGYETRLMERCDLEPRVTLSVAHTIVQVCGPKGTKYIVDPSYLQFHKDVCSEESSLPKLPVLILGESESETYVEKELMSRWKLNLELVEKEDQEADG